MPKFIKRFQNIIYSAATKQAGRQKVKEATTRMLAEFSNDIMSTVMSAEAEGYLIQWAISELNKDECDIHTAEEKNE